MVITIQKSKNLIAPCREFVKDPKKQPTRITRKTSKEWTQTTEISFLRYDLPVECAMRNMNLINSLKGYINAIKKRRKPFMEGHPPIVSELIDVAREVMAEPPRVWNIGELKSGERDHQWAIKYPNRDIISYTSY